MANYPHVRVVGMHFRGSHAKQFVAALQPGDKTLTLLREPDNQHDAFAIKVMAPGEEPWHLGYVERGAASFIAIEMDAGEAFEVEVREVTTEGKNQIPVVSITRV